MHKARFLWAPLVVLAAVCGCAGGDEEGLYEVVVVRDGGDCPATFLSTNATVEIGRGHHTTVRIEPNIFTDSPPDIDVILLDAEIEAGDIVAESTRKLATYTKTGLCEYAYDFELTGTAADGMLIATITESGELPVEDPACPETTCTATFSLSGPRTRCWASGRLGPCP